MSGQLASLANGARSSTPRPAAVTPPKHFRRFRNEPDLRWFFAGTKVPARFRHVHHIYWRRQRILRNCLVYDFNQFRKS